MDIGNFSHGYIVFPITFSFIFGLFFTLFDRCLWKLSVVNKFVKIPDISGKFKCTGRSFKKTSSELQENGISTVEHQYNWEAEINIFQTWTNICIILHTKQSESESFMAQFEVFNDNLCQIIYCYVNATIGGADADMRNHEGMCKILFTENMKNGTGTYFTNPKDRLSYGTMKWIKS